MSKILITGASGLLGTEFCRQLKEAGHEVWAIDNHSRSTTIPPCDKWIKMDLLNSDSFTGYADLPTDFDYIYHYGAINVLIFIRCLIKYWKTTLLVILMYSTLQRSVQS